MHAVNGNEDTGTASLTERRQRLGLIRNSTATRRLPGSISNETFARVTVEGLSIDTDRYRYMFLPITARRF
jgi:hypothetical protein